jgi:hypothetical protein
MTTATAPRTRSTIVKLRRAAVVSAAVVAMGAVAGCGGRDDTSATKDHAKPFPAAVTKHDRPSPSSFTADPPSTAATGDWGADNEYGAEAKRTFMASCERSSGGMTSFCHCALDELQQVMTLSEFLHESLGIVDGKRPSKKLVDAVKSCAPSSSGRLDIS